MSNPEYRARLQTMLEEILKELQSVGIHSPENSSDWIAVPEEHDIEEPDENLSADSIESLNERTALVATLEPQYNNITAALARIEAGTFGICEICKQPIEEKRLGANPVSRTCVEHMDEIIPSVS